MTVDALVKHALIGTAREPVTLATAADAALGETLALLSAASSEAQLLGAVAVLSAYESCGRAPAAAASLPSPAAVDRLPACSARAADLLGELLAMTNTPAKQQLLDEWLMHAARAGRRVPHRTIPALLEYGASFRALRERIAIAVDARGQWLMSLNPRWQFGVAEEEEAESVWATGSADQRAIALRRLRGTDAAHGRDLVASTWKEDGADDRSSFVSALRVGLSADDEPFLESALDDRSKQVRTAASELLAALPESAYVQRMTQRATAHLTLTAPAKGGPLKRATPKRIEINLPGAFDKAWLRDGVTEKPDSRSGQKQWWLQQLISAVPVTHWSTMWGLTPAECVTAANATDFGEMLIAAWSNAVFRQPDPAWAEAILLARAVDEKSTLPAGMLNELQADAQSALTTRLLEVPAMQKLPRVSEFLNHTRVALNARAAMAIVKAIDVHVTANRTGYDYHVASILGDLALRVPPAMHDELAARWKGDAWEQNTKALDQFLRTLQLRRDIEKEFATHP